MNGLKDFLQRKFPRPYGALQTARYKYALQHAFAQLTADHGLVVQGGPFKGMKYVPQIATPARLIGDALLPKLVGCYEAELHGTLATLPQAKYTRIVNIGCAKGAPVLRGDGDGEWRRGPGPNRRGVHGRSSQQSGV